MATGSRINDRPRSIRWRLVATAAGLLVAIGLITATVHLANHNAIDWLATHKNRIVAAEIGIFGAILTELFAAVVIRFFERAGAIQLGISVRAVFRVACYLVMLVAIVSILAANPALAIGVGGVTGVVVAFSAQNLVANAFAGVFLSVARPFNIGEEITVMGLTGKVTDIRVMHTRLDLGERIALIPSNTMMAQALQRAPRTRRMDWEFEEEKEGRE